MPKVLFLHGFSGEARGKKYLSLSDAGFDLVPPPSFKHTDVSQSISIAQQACDEHMPDVIVGSSLGGAVALRLKTTARLVLMAPAVDLSKTAEVMANIFFRKESGFVPFVKNPPSPWRLPSMSIVIQSRNDDLVPFPAVERMALDLAASSAGDETAIRNRIEQDLVAAGYQPLAGRLVEAGCDHQLNSAAEGTP